jgi:UDP-N-acetyl-D-mannosaminuronic acid dehydrogenase
MIISVIGLGYIGLPLAALFASKAVEVIGVDIDKDVVHKVNHNESDTIEPGLKEMVSQAVSMGYLRATAIPQHADVYIIAVPTPIDSNKAPSLTYFNNAIHSIAPYLRKGNIIIIESTVPLNTVANTANLLKQLRPDLSFPENYHTKADIGLAYCPERVLPGQALQELVEIDRTIGGLNESSGYHAYEIYRIFSKGNFYITNATTAAMVKLAENAYRDVNIAFANELSVLCDQANINVHEVISIANYHPRVNILNPGPGVGGHCIPIDPWFIINDFPGIANLIHSARVVNDSKTDYVYQQILKILIPFQNPNIAILGMGYKANSDDVRGSPALEIIQKLALHTNFRLLISDPYHKTLPAKLTHLANIHVVDLEQALQFADIIVILVGHDQYKVDNHYFSSIDKPIFDAVGIMSQQSKVKLLTQ